jgi:hypothetical protein
VRRAAGRTGVAIVLAALIAAACSSSSPSHSTATTAPSGSAASTTSGALTASARGVTPTTIKIGFSYPDLEALAKTGLIKVSWGPVEPILTALVNDINSRGGINGRKLQLYFGKFGVLGSTDQLTACTKLTEDDQVFAILGGFIGDNNLCALQQHATMVIFSFGAGFNQITIGKAKAPFITNEASDERSTKALVQILDQQGRLKGKTIGVYGTLSASKPLVDLTVKDLKDAGYTVKDTAINDVDASDTQAFNAQDKVIGQRFKDEGIDTVFVQVTVPPGTNWDNVGYHPSFFQPQTSLIGSGAFTNPYNKFPMVAGLAATADPNLGYDSAPMQRCRAVWKKASGQDVKPPTEELKEGKSSGFTALSGGCTLLYGIFVPAATAAGADLTYATFMKGLESLGKIDLPGTPAASFGPNKPDAQDNFQLMQLNPAWKSGSTAQEFLPLGPPLTQS